MDCHLERATAVTVITSLFLLACHAGVISGGEPSSSSASALVEYRKTVHARKLVINATRRDPRGVADAAVYAAEGTTAPDGCSEEVVQVSQVIAGSLPNGIPCYSVTVTNTCLACTVRDVHVSCGNFASTELVDPSNFRRLAYADCLVKDGEPIGPGETVSFEYSNSFIYNMDVASVSCGDV